MIIASITGHVTRIDKIRNSEVFRTIYSVVYNVLFKRSPVSPKPGKISPLAVSWGSTAATQICKTVNIATIERAIDTHIEVWKFLLDVFEAVFGREHREKFDFGDCAYIQAVKEGALFNYHLEHPNL